MHQKYLPECYKYPAEALSSPRVFVLRLFSSIALVYFLCFLSPVKMPLLPVVVVSRSETRGQKKRLGFVEWHTSQAERNTNRPEVPILCASFPECNSKHLNINKDTENHTHTHTHTQRLSHNWFIYQLSHHWELKEKWPQWEWPSFIYLISYYSGRFLLYFSISDIENLYSYLVIFPKRKKRGKNILVLRLTLLFRYFTFSHSLIQSTTVLYTSVKRAQFSVQ